MQPEPSTTHLLRLASEGDQHALEQAWNRVYGELREIAHQRLLRHRPGETLNTTALVHEAYLKLAGAPELTLHDREHFFAMASRAMRFILVDYVRRRTADKRGGLAADLQLKTADAEGLATEADGRATDLLALNDALEALLRSDGRLGRLVEYRFFGGLSYDEIAELTGRSVTTIARDWRRARTWLYRSMQEPGAASAPG